MLVTSQSEVFQFNIRFWKVLGIWQEKTSSRLYKYYCVLFFFIVWIVNLLVCVISLLNTPPKFEIIINGVMFFFSIIAALIKAQQVFFRHDKILSMFKMLDSKKFLHDTETTQQIIKNNKEYYKKYWISYFLTCSMGVFSVYLSLLIYFITKKSRPSLRICQYNFLNENIRERYYFYFYIYDCVVTTCVIFYDANIDSFICGLMLMAITQFKVLNFEISNLSVNSTGETSNAEQELIMKQRLVKILKHYDYILEFYDEVQKFVGVPIFAQFSIGGITICVSMCSFINPNLRKDLLFMMTYITVMTLQIFIPAKLGADLNKESSDLTHAAYCSDWIARPESFKRSLRLLMERASKPIVISAMHIFEVSLVTFASIIKTAYSLFTLMTYVMENDD